MKMQVLSVKVSEFTDKQTGAKKQMWQIWAPDETGAVGTMYSTEPVSIGDTIEVKLLANRDGKFAAKIIHPPKAENGSKGTGKA